MNDSDLRRCQLAHRLNFERVDERCRVAHRHQDVADVRRAIRRTGRHRQRRHLGKTLLQIAANRSQAPIHLPRPRIRFLPIRRFQRATGRPIRIDDDHAQRQNREEKTRKHKLSTDLHRSSRDGKTKIGREGLDVILSRRSDEAEAEVAQDGRRTPFLVTRDGRR
jgi:hypothetical protein